MMIKKKLTLLSVFFKKNESSILTIMFLSIVADIFFPGASNDIRIFSITTIYIASIWFYKIKSRATFIFALFILAIMFILLLFTSTSANTEKAAVWLFFLIAIGIFQQMRER